MGSFSKLVLRSCVLFYFSLSLFTHAVAQEQDTVTGSIAKKRIYSKGDTVPVTCLNRTIETGEHITDDHGNLQYIPFLHCAETNNAPLSFIYGEPRSYNCTIESLSDEFYHLLQYFVHSDVPLSCRVPSYPLTSDDALSAVSISSDYGANAAADAAKWTPLTIALQGVFQLSHLHIHTNINVLFHTFTGDQDLTDLSKKEKAKLAAHDTPSHLIASAAYSLPDPKGLPEGAKIVRNEPLKFTFNVGWIPGSILPGMVNSNDGRLYMGVTDHTTGFSLLSFFAIVGSGGTGALLMLLYERRKRGRADKFGNGILPTNGFVNTGAPRSSGYGGYGGYGGSYGPGKRD